MLVIIIIRMATSDTHSYMNSFEHQVTQIKLEIERRFRQLTEYLKTRKEKLLKDFEEFKTVTN